VTGDKVDGDRATTQNGSESVEFTRIERRWVHRTALSNANGRVDSVLVTTISRAPDSRLKCVRSSRRMIVDADRRGRDAEDQRRQRLKSTFNKCR
jgi:hypothetical protein